MGHQVMQTNTDTKERDGISNQGSIKVAVWAQVIVFAPMSATSLALAGGLSFRPASRVLGGVREEDK